MSDRPSTEPGTGSVADGSTPPPAPWWSNPGGAWGAPTETAPDTRPYGAPSQPAYGSDGRASYWPPAPSSDSASSGSVPEPAQGSGSAPVQPPYGEAAYGQHGYGQAGYGDAQHTEGGQADTLQGGPDEPRGGSYAFPPPGSYREPAQAPWGAPTDTAGRSDGRRRRRLGVASAVLATALVAGGVGGLVGSRSTGDGLIDPTASLGGSSSTAPTVEREPGTVPAVAAQVLKSTVSIAVQSGTGAGTGSGVVIRSDGYILTNNHVVASARNGGRITVTINSGGRALPADIVGLDPETDLAVLKVQGAQQLQPAALGQSRDLVVGDPVIAIGSPLGLAGTVTTGIVSALNRSPAVPGEDGGRTFLANAIQTDAAINPGNSGGALVNAKGEVVGINSAIATLGGSGGGSGSIGIGFAIPIDEARDIAEEIIRTGRATHPAIGVEAATVTGDERREGARISSVAPGGGAERAGLQSGDVIVQVADTEVTSVDELILAVRQYDVGEQVEITYLRDGERRTATATLQDKRQR